MVDRMRAASVKKDVRASARVRQVSKVVIAKPRIPIGGNVGNLGNAADNIPVLVACPDGAAGLVNTKAGWAERTEQLTQKAGAKRRFK